MSERFLNVVVGFACVCLGLASLSVVALVVAVIAGVR